MLGDLRVDDVLAEGIESRESALLVRPDKARLSDHVGGEDSNKLALDAFFGHRAVFSQMRRSEPLFM